MNHITRKLLSLFFAMTVALITAALLRSSF
jgi:hypothetical protein